MFIRHAVESDHERILSFIRRDPINWIDAQRYRRDIVSGSYRANRIWLAEDNLGHVLACALCRSGFVDEFFPDQAAVVEHVA